MQYRIVGVMTLAQNTWTKALVGPRAIFFIASLGDVSHFSTDCRISISARGLFSMHANVGDAFARLPLTSFNAATGRLGPICHRMVSLTARGFPGNPVPHNLVLAFQTRGLCRDRRRNHPAGNCILGGYSIFVRSWGVKNCRHCVA